jgi:archaellum biogenesis ATPase FlaH
LESDSAAILAESLKGLERPIVLCLVDPNRYQEAVESVLRYLTGRLHRGIYITFNKPVATLTKLFEKVGLPVESLFFIDGITVVSSPVEERSYTFLGPATDLTNLCVATSRAVGRFDEEKFIVLDSLSTLLIYNEGRAVCKFAHLLTEKMRRWGTSGFLLTVEMNPKRDLVPQLAPFCDKVVKI